MFKISIFKKKVEKEVEILGLGMPDLEYNTVVLLLKY